ncbi:TonB-dependent receptor [Niveispirillum sp. BGYR6]|uniref:TonB-dependent receptor n=1 Tax=Niveispirillum sp. BGYR6 TaxID=2971249 RepID=UPI0022B9989C|nr:TonB-dependent receptor [Niveispirillum sp. BGYR6]MDG5493845.1 TonB-dependent receptor [Niveispirillum sp. BGYR6]
MRKISFKPPQLRVRLLASAALLSTLSISQAYAQQQSQSNDLEEIVVTAEKRSSTIQQTPISITAVTGDQLLKQGIADVARLATQTPGISIASSGPGRTQFNIRGLSGNGGSSPTVGFYLDDVPVTPPASQIAAAGKVQIDPTLYDLARVEVLRGPQGTLYGASSMGGTIRLITNGPQMNNFHAKAQGELSSTKGGGTNYSGNVMLNIPLVDDKLAVRLVGTDRHNDGFIDRVILNNFPLPQGNDRGNVLAAPVARVIENDNSDRLRAFRGTLLFTPTENLTIEPAIFHQKLTTSGLSAIDMPPGRMAHYQPTDVNELSSQRFDAYSLRLKYDIGGVSLQSITSVLRLGSFIKEDDAESQFFAFGPLGKTGLAADNYTTERHSSRQINEEFRVSSNYDSPLQWLAGAYYSKYRDDLYIRNTVDDLIPVFGTNNAFTDEERDTLKQKALFGEANYQFLPEWKLTLGLRYFTYRFSYTQNATGLAAQTGLFSGTARDSGLTPKATLTYTPDRDLLVYATASEGFRPGGPNLPIPTSGAIDCTNSFKELGLKGQPPTFGPDRVWNYELGQKAKLFDGKVTFNSALYYIDWTDIQQQTTLSCGYNFTANSGRAYSKGAEAEMSARLGWGFTLQQSVGYTRSALTRISLPGNSPLDQQLPDVPRWTATTALEYADDISDDLSLSARVSNRYIGGQYNYSAVPASLTRKPSYDILDARISVSGDSWTASLFVDNITNRRAIVGINRSQAQNNPYFARAFINRPRTFGLSIETEF